MIKKLSYISSAFLIILLSSFSQQTQLESSKLRGRKLYKGLCSGCHKQDGSGYVENRLAPPLAGSDYLLENKSNGIRAVLFGVTGKIIVNNIEYDRNMPPVEWNDEEISDVLNYVRNSWGNQAAYVAPAEVQKARTSK